MVSELPAAGLHSGISFYCSCFVLQRLDQPWSSFARFTFVFSVLHFHSLVNNFRYDLLQQLLRVGFAKFFVRFFCYILFQLRLFLFNFHFSFNSFVDFLIRRIYLFRELPVINSLFRKLEPFDVRVCDRLS